MSESEGDEEVINTVKTVAATMYVAGLAYQSYKRPYRKRKRWADNFFDESKRGDAVMREVLISDRYGYKALLRVDNEEFSYLLEKITPYIRKEDTVMRNAIIPEIRLGIALRFIATGDCYQSIAILNRVSETVVQEAVPLVFWAFAIVLKPYMKMPKFAWEWKKIAREFEIAWQFIHCLGALDGKHVRCQAFANSGSLFFNYKEFFSIVLLALVDARKNFIYVDVGCQGRVSDGGVLENSKLGRLLKSGELDLPNDEGVNDFCWDLPYPFVGDGAFPLGKNLLTPIEGSFPRGHPNRIFNMRLSRARHCVEATFGIMSSLFRAYRKGFYLSMEHTKTVVFGSCYLYNFIRRKVTIDTDEMYDDLMREGISKSPSPMFTKPKKCHLKSNRGIMHRRDFVEFFSSPQGSLGWQNKK